MNTDKAYAERIASEYAPKRDSKVAALKKLDARARRPAEILAYVLGILSALVLGVGMCLSMGVVGPGTGAAFLGGIVLGLAGLAGAGLNYPLYTTCRVAMAVVNLRRAGRRGEPLIRELRTVGMVDALVSLLTLQNTLIAIHADGRSMAGLTAWTSGGILLVILAVTASSFYQAARPGKH